MVTPTWPRKHAIPLCEVSHSTCDLKLKLVLNHNYWSYWLFKIRPVRVISCSNFRSIKMCKLSAAWIELNQSQWKTDLEVFAAHYEDQSNRKGSRPSGHTLALVILSSNPMCLAGLRFRRSKGWKDNSHTIHTLASINQDEVEWLLGNFYHESISSIVYNFLSSDINKYFPSPLLPRG